MYAYAASGCIDTCATFLGSQIRAAFWLILEAGEKVVKALNDAINIPFINEKTEGKVLSALWSVVVDVLKQILRQ